MKIVILFLSVLFATSCSLHKDKGHQNIDITSMSEKELISQRINGDEIPFDFARYPLVKYKIHAHWQIGFVPLSQNFVYT